MQESSLSVTVPSLSPRCPNPQVGTLQYMAPEVLLGSAPHSPASDVFALAVTLNELAAGAVPYSDCTRDNPLAHTVLEMGYGRQELAAAVAAEGLRPTVPPGTPPALRALLRACWAADPAARPSGAHLRDALAALAAEAEAEAAGDAAGQAACLSPQASLLPVVTAVPTPVLADTAGCRPYRVGAAVAAPAQQPLQGSTDVDMAEPAGARGTPSPIDVLSSPGSSGCSSPARSGSLTAAPGRLPAWLAAGATAGASAGATFASSQHAGGSAADDAAPVHVGSYLAQGRRDSMEDTIAVLPDALRGAAPGAPACTALGVFDGHRGGAAAEYLAASLQGHLAARLGDSASGADLLRAALLDADVAFRAEQDTAWAARVARVGAAAAGQRPAPGATATVLLLYPGGAARKPAPEAGQQQLMLSVANLGDSRAVLCRDGQVGGRGLSLRKRRGRC